MCLTALLTLILSFIFLVVAQSNPFPIQLRPANLSNSDGWSCDDFPCEDDIEGFFERIQVPAGFALSHVGQFPGQPMQITYGSDERLYGTILEKGTRRGAVYVLNDDGTSERISPRFWSPVGIAFDEVGQLFVSGRVNPDSNGAIWRVDSQLSAEIIVENLPCCYSLDNQPNGMIFGDDGLLYIGVGSTSDRGESSQPESERFATPQPFEASILQININSGDIQVYANGIRNPYDLSFTPGRQLYVTDNGLVTGQGDRILQVNAGEFYGFPYWRSRGCPECPRREGRDAQDDWLLLADYTLPRGIVAYDGTQFPANMLNTLFVTFWNGTDYAQSVVWIDPADAQLNDEDYTPLPFVTGLVRPVDVTVAPDGSLVVADFVYGHIWQVSYDESGSDTSADLPPIVATVVSNEEPIQESLPPAVATVITNSENDVDESSITPTPNSSGITFATATPAG